MSGRKELAWRNLHSFEMLKDVKEGHAKIIPPPLFINRLLLMADDK